ncbi:hypothetical protein CTZ40_41970 (plasmid) [Streptomyces rimosus]|nr:hypothetical protein CTZ40_41970 [Streptomyces rimosus]
MTITALRCVTGGRRSLTCARPSVCGTRKAGTDSRRRPCSATARTAIRHQPGRDCGLTRAVAPARPAVRYPIRFETRWPQRLRGPGPLAGAGQASHTADHGHGEWGSDGSTTTASAYEETHAQAVVTTCRTFTKAALGLAVRQDIVVLHRDLLGSWVKGAHLETLIRLNGSGGGTRRPPAQ